ncbi:hypothetical protein SK128_023669, partial [Halocaridina rubra]
RKRKKSPYCKKEDIEFPSDEDDVSEDFYQKNIEEKIVIPEDTDQSSNDLKEYFEREAQHIENEKKSFKCNCGKVAKGLDALVEHQLLRGCKIKRNEFSCKYCGSFFSEKKTLIVHKKQCIRESLVNGAYLCDICGRRMKTNSISERIEGRKDNYLKERKPLQALPEYYKVCGTTIEDHASKNKVQHPRKNYGQ